MEQTQIFIFKSIDIGICPLEIKAYISKIEYLFSFPLIKILYCINLRVQYFVLL